MINQLIDKVITKFQIEKRFEVISYMSLLIKLKVKKIFIIVHRKCFPKCSLYR